MTSTHIYCVLKRGRLKIKIGESTIESTPEDLYAFTLTVIAVSLSVALILFAWQGDYESFLNALMFLWGMGLTEGVRRVVGMKIYKRVERKRGRA